MKNFKTASLCIGVAIALITGITACSPREGATRYERWRGLPEKITARFDRTFTSRGCIKGRGMCIKWYRIRKKWEDTIPPDEMRGKLWVTRNRYDTFSINCVLEKQKLSRELYNELVFNRTLTIEEDTYIPQDLVYQAYTNAGIRNVPQEVKIAKGQYPVALDDPPKKQGPGNLYNTTATATIPVMMDDQNIKIIIVVPIDTDP